MAKKRSSSPVNPERLILAAGSLAAVQTGGKYRQYHARFVRAGQVLGSDRKPAGISITAEALQDAVMRDLFEAKAVFADHAAFFDYPSVDSLVGVTCAASWNDADQAVEGIVQLYSTPGAQIVAQLLDDILSSPQTAPDVGLSMVFYPVREGDVITGITHIESIDLVFQPAADGRILQALSSANVQAVRSVSYSTAEMPYHSLDSNVQAPYLTKGEPNMTTSTTESEAVVIPTQQPQPASAVSNLGLPSVAIVQTILRSGLPAAAQERLAAQSFPDLPTLTAAIESERQYLAAINEPNVVQLTGSAPRSGHISGMLDSLDRVSLAAEALLLGVRPPHNIQPLTGIRELYNLLSGDYDMTGVFHPERVQFANVTSSTMAGIVANALNKVVINEFQQYPKWWETIVQQMDFATLQAVKWITLGGVGELPTVAEGAAYTELTWDDNTETASFVKKGGYLGVTLEAIDKDDTGRVAAAPRALAQAAWLTLSKSISAIFTAASGTGPTLADGQVLFYARSAGTNVGSTALSITSWNATKLAMRKFTELNSGERLGGLVVPKFLLVPPDLEVTAIQVLASENDYLYALSNGVAAPVNDNAQGNDREARMAFARQRVIVADLWTDANNWAAIADPRMYPTIGLGFRYGRVPEIFSVASPTAGLMFTNDTMPVKVRFFYATGPMDWRGMYKHNVA